jgi:hypothetical protein
MATVQQNNVVILKEQPAMYPAAVDGTFDIKAGDLVYFDTSAKIIKTLDSDAHAAYLAGLATQGSYIQPYSTKEYLPSIAVARKAIVKLYTTTGDTYYHGDAVYWGGTAQRITNTVGGMSYIIGYVVLDKDSAAGGLAGLTDVTQVKIDLTPRHPAADFA